MWLSHSSHFAVDWGFDGAPLSVDEPSADGEESGRITLARASSVFTEPREKDINGSLCGGLSTAHNKEKG